MAEQGAGGAPAPGTGEGGDGGESQVPGLGLYDLSAAPQELRPFLEQELKKYDGNVTKKFQEHADFRKRFEPYQEVDFGDVPADELGELLQFRQILADPEQLQEWLSAVNEQFGLGGPTDPNEWLRMGQENGWIDAEGNFDAAGGAGEEQMPAWAQQLSDRLDEIDGGFKQFQGKTEAEQAAVKQGEAFAKRLGELDISEEDRPLVIQEAHLFISDDDPIGKAWEHVQTLRGTAEGDRMQERLETNGQQGGALNGGQVNGAAESLSFGDPGLKQAALARMRQGA